MPRSIQSAIDTHLKGFVRFNSVFLPCHFELLSVWVGKEMSLLAKPDVLVDFVGEKAHVGIREGTSFTNLVFRQHKELNRELGRYKGHVVLQVVEKGGDVFDPAARHFLKLGFHDDEDEVSLELIDDPFNL